MGCQEKNLSQPGSQSFFLTASPAVLMVTDVVVTGDHCQLSQCEQLRA
jgi:hypothetical protein